MRGIVYPARGGNDTHAGKGPATSLQIVDADRPGGMVGCHSAGSGDLRALVYPKFISAMISLKCLSRGRGNARSQAQDFFRAPTITSTIPPTSTNPPSTGGIATCFCSSAVA